jgi:hypothetical protein
MTIVSDDRKWQQYCNGPPGAKMMTLGAQLATLGWCSKLWLITYNRHLCSSHVYRTRQRGKFYRHFYGQNLCCGRGRLSTVDFLIKVGCFVKKDFFQLEKQLIWNSKCKGAQCTEPSPSVRIPWRDELSWLVWDTINSTAFLIKPFSSQIFKFTIFLLNGPSRNCKHFIPLLSNGPAYKKSYGISSRGLCYKTFFGRIAIS